ncbi:MAG: ExeA family protein [Myxococcota bacterium]
MEHLEFFELPADPFQNDADTRFYYESAPQKRARLRLLRGIHQKKTLSVLVGGPGLGKTTLAQVVLKTLEGKDYAAHYLSIPHEACSTGWLLPNVARGFGVPLPSAQVSQLIDQIHAQLVAIATSRRTPVLLIDEAQLFRNRDAMEEFRGLLNLTHEGKRLLSMVLFGLHELADILKLDPPLAQRVEVRVEMTAMDWLESQAYVSHRLRLAGASQAVFSPDALEALFRWSNGVPRVLNTLADNALFEAFLTETKPVDSPVVQTAAEALGLLRAASDSVPNIPPLAPPAPDLLGATEVKLAARPARTSETMPVARPSPALRGPEPKPQAAPAPAPEPEPESEEPELAALVSDNSTPDWLEPLSPMPEDVPAADATLIRVTAGPAIEPPAADEMDFELEEVIAEDTVPPTPARARPAAKSVAPDPEPEPEPEVAEELELGMEDDDSDDADFSLASLVNDGDGDSEEEAALAELSPDPEPEPEPDLAPVRRTPPIAKSASVSKPVTPARATPAKATPAKATPAKPGPAIATSDDGSFDLGSLVAEEDTGSGALQPPAKDTDDDDLDALFDEIRIGDK